MRNWHDLLPREWAIRQESYERNKTMLRMRLKAKMKFKDIAKTFGISPERARQIVHKAERQKVAPVEIFFKEKDELYIIAGWEKAQSYLTPKCKAELKVDRDFRNRKYQAKKERERNIADMWAQREKCPRNPYDQFVTYWGKVADNVQGLMSAGFSEQSALAHLFRPY